MKQVTVVTGAASGLGKAVAIEVASRGDIVIVFDLSTENGKTTEQQLKDSGYEAVFVKTDVSNHDEVFKNAKWVYDTFGRINNWVNCAGVSFIAPFLQHTVDMINKTIDINLKGTLFACQAAVTYLKMNENGGNIVNFSSLAGKKVSDSYGAYCASKAGVIAMSESIALEFAHCGIRCNVVCPGIIKTPMWDKQLNDYAIKRNIKPEEVMPRFEKKIPLGRLGTLEDVVNSTMFLLSYEARYLTGQILDVSGGLVLK